MARVNMSTENKPLDFSLLIPCYNNFEGLILSLKSINYPADSFITVVVDDGSKNPVTLDLVTSKIQIDYKIVILRDETNKGITYALNQGLKWIEDNTNAKYIARLDCGDQCDFYRFYKQISYLDKHPDIGLLGSWCIFQDKTSSVKYQYRTPVSHKQIKRAMYFRNVFIHPTVIFRKSLLKQSGYYPYQFLYAEDYAFFWILLKKSTSSVLGEFLVISELNSEGISHKHRKVQLTSRARVIKTFGTNAILKTSGRIKLIVLKLIPHRIVLQMKKLLNG